MLPFNDPNLQKQAMGFNSNFNNRNPPSMGNLSSNGPNNFYGANPNLPPPPMAQSNQIGALQLLAMQLQSNHQLHQQIHLLNQQLQAQNNLPASVHAPLLSQNLAHTFNPALGLSNPQFLAQFQGLANPQFLAHNQMLQANQMAGLLGQNCMNPEISNPNVPGDLRQNAPWNKNRHRSNAGQQFQVNHSEAERTCNPSADAQTPCSNGPTRKFRGFAKGKQSHNRFQKPQLHDMRSSKENMGQFNRKGGQHNLRNQQLPFMSSAEETKTVHRPLAITYTEHEINQWREARKKNFPTSDRIKKKGPNGDINNEDTDNDSKLRRQQLKEVLAKQAELGVEVAEVPSSYFCELEDRSLQVSNRPLNNNNPNRKRARGHGRDNWRAKRSKPRNQGAHANTVVKTEPSLLKQLLSADIKRDRSRLLQVFRFMVLNDFFKQWPDQPLEFPAITVRDGNEIISEEINLSVNLANSSVVVEAVAEKTMVEEVAGQQRIGVAEEVENESDDEDVDRTGAVQPIEEEESGYEDQFKRSEEGEITD